LSGVLVGLDLVVIAAYLTVALGAGLLLARRSRGTMENFFLSGRNLPWWVAGTSMVATTFAADTPLLITGYTRAAGTDYNWRWWAYLIGNLLVVVVFARLWRRSRVLTDVEFMQLRYSGRPAHWLRSFKAVYQMLCLHAFVMGWVILAMTKVFAVVIGLGDEPLLAVGGLELTPAWAVTLGCIVLALVYSELAGLWGVVATDFVQFGLALAGAIMLVMIVAAELGGLGGMIEAIRAAPDAQGKLGLTPSFEGVDPADPSSWTAEAVRFLVFLGVLWFATKNADGSGVMVQRILASRDESHALKGVLWYSIAHNAIRPWPWILVALASFVFLPSVVVASPVDGVVREVSATDVVVAPSGGGAPVAVEVPRAPEPDWPIEARVGVGDAVGAGAVLASTDEERAYPEMMKRFLPAGLLGFMVASFLAAFMSTIDSHVNVASSYLVNDVYKRHVRPDAPPGHYVRVARWTGPLVAAVAVVYAALSDSMRSMFDVFTTLFGGVGAVYLLRWVWWRVNAFSEIAALSTSALLTVAMDRWPAPFAGALPAQLVDGGAPAFEGRLVLVAGLSLVVALAVTLATPPTAPAQLATFYRRVRPPGAWGPVRGPLGIAAERPTFWLRVLLAWSAAVGFVVACIVLPGHLLLEGGTHAWRWAALGAGGLLVLWLALPALGAPEDEPAA